MNNIGADGKWSEEERQLFIEGTSKYGNGNWKKIAKDVVLTRTAAQVAGYADNHWLPNPNIKNAEPPAAHTSKSPKEYIRLFGNNIILNPKKERKIIGQFLTIFLSGNICIRL